MLIAKKEKTMKQRHIISKLAVFLSSVSVSLGVMAIPIESAITVNLSSSSDISKKYKGFSFGSVSYSCGGNSNSIIFTPADNRRGVGGGGCSADAWTPSSLGVQVGLESDMNAEFGSASARLDNYIFDFTVNSSSSVSFILNWFIEADASPSSDAVTLASLSAVLEIFGRDEMDSLGLSMYNRSLTRNGDPYSNAIAVSGSDILSLSASEGDKGRLTLNFRSSARRSDPSASVPGPTPAILIFIGIMAIVTMQKKLYTL